MKTNATRRAAMVWIGAFPAAVTVAGTATATAGLGTAQWDRSLDRYLEAREAYDHDLKHGELRRAYDRHHALKNPTKAETNLMFDAEAAHHGQFGTTREAALTALLLTPAPTIGTLRQKVWIAQTEYVDSVGEDDRPILSIISDDLTRIAGKGVGRG